MPNPTPILSRLIWVGLGKETTQGTPVAPTIFIPVSTATKPTDTPDYIDDDSLVGSAGKIRGTYQGILRTGVSLDGFAFPDSIGSLLVAAGLADTVSGTTPNFTHTFKLPVAGTQPPSWTIVVWEGGVNAQARQYPGQVLDTLDITLDIKGAVKWAAKFMGWPSSLVTKPSPTFPTTAPWLSWQAALTIGGTANPKPVSGKISIKRSSEYVDTMANVQTPYNVFADAMEAAWALKMLMTDEVDWTHAISNDQPAVVLSLTAPSSGPVLTFTSTKGAWKKAPPDFSGKKVMLDADITSITNATDVGPIAATLLNAVATAY